MRRATARARVRDRLRREPRRCVRRRRRERDGRARRGSSATADIVAGAIGPLGCTGGAAPAFARTRAYVRVQDGCSFGCSYCVIPAVRGASRSRAAEAVLREAGAPCGAGPPRGRADRASTSAAFAIASAGCDLARSAGGGGDVRRDRARAPVVDRDQPPDRRPARALDHPRRVRRICTCRCSRADDRVLRAMRRRYDRAGFLAQARAGAGAVRGPQPDQRRDRRPPGRGRAGLRRHARRRCGGRASRRCTCFATRRGPTPPTAGTTRCRRRSRRERSRRLRALSDRQGQRPPARRCAARRAAGAGRARTAAAATRPTTRRWSMRPDGGWPPASWWR